MPKVNAYYGFYKCEHIFFACGTCHNMFLLYVYIFLIQDNVVLNMHVSEEVKIYPEVAHRKRNLNSI